MLTRWNHASDIGPRLFCRDNPARRRDNFMELRTSLTEIDPLAPVQSRRRVFPCNI
jgi:hypothetical protein